MVRKLAWEFHQASRVGTIACRLPPHISLKQPFPITNLAALEGYLDSFARTITPFEIRLSKLQVVPTWWNGTEYGILWIDVEQTEALRTLHNRLNQELRQQFENTEAPFDGPDYHFHMTVAIGGQSIEVYRQFYQELPDHRIDRSYITQELAMFVYDEPGGPQGDFLTYKRLPIGKQQG